MIVNKVLTPGYKPLAQTIRRLILVEGNISKRVHLINYHEYDTLFHCQYDALYHAKILYETLRNFVSMTQCV